MSDKADLKPLDPAAAQANNHLEQDLSQDFDGQLHKRNLVRCCGFIVAVMLLLSVTVIVLFTTVFRVHDPTVQIKTITIQRLETVNGTLRTGVNVTLLSDVSIKNPNVAAFKLTDTATSVYYNGTLVGEDIRFGDAVKARRTVRRNVTLELIPEKIMAVPRFGSDITSGSLTLISSTRISGRVRLLGIIKKDLKLQLDCATIYHINSKEFEAETTCNAQHVN